MGIYNRRTKPIPITIRPLKSGYIYGIRTGVDYKKNNDILNNVNLIEFYNKGDLTYADNINTRRKIIR